MLTLHGRMANAISDRTPGLPSGRQITIGHGEQRATIVEVGGAIRDYRVGDRALLDGFPADEMCTGARGQTLLPWPNRVRDGRYAFADQALQLALTEPKQHNAIHGLTRWANWSVALEEPARVVLRHRLHAQQGWPFVLDLELEYALAGDGLTVRTSATNRGSKPCPYGAGAHPYLTLGAPTIDDAFLTIPARTYLPTGAQQIPIGRRAVDGGELDFRTPRRIGGTRIDFAFTDLERDADGRARVVLAAADGSAAVALWVDEHYRFVELFTGDTLERADKRRTGLGVEPMTCPPNALQTGEALVVLAPGESFTSRWGVEWRPADRADP